jgi:threonine/homoserine/homoserine lactone efflux protein
MGVLPGFFDLSRVHGWDIAAILAISALVPMVGNLVLALFLDRVRLLLQSPEALRRMNVGSGVLLVLVGLVIPFT